MFLSGHLLMWSNLQKMKTSSIKFIIALIILSFSTKGFCQDLIWKTNYEVTNGLITEIADDSITYISAGSRIPLKVAKTDIISIRYKNGEIERFEGKKTNTDFNFNKKDKFLNDETENEIHEKNYLCPTLGYSQTSKSEINADGLPYKTSYGVMYGLEVGITVKNCWGIRAELGGFFQEFTVQGRQQYNSGKSAGLNYFVIGPQFQINLKKNSYLVFFSTIGYASEFVNPYSITKPAKGLGYVLGGRVRFPIDDEFWLIGGFQYGNTLFMNRVFAYGSDNVIMGIGVGF